MRGLGFVEWFEAIAWRAYGDGWADSRAEKIPDRSRGGDLVRHLFGGARRAVVLVRVAFGLRGGGAGGLGDAGNEALDQLDGAFHGAAGVGADVFVGGEGDHEAEDASGGIAGSDGYGGGCDSINNTGASRTGQYAKRI